MLREIGAEFKKYRSTVFLVFAFFMTASFAFFAASNMNGTSAVVSTAGFNPGNIISDAVMANYNSMSLSEIQNFLTSKNGCNNTSYSYYQQLSAASPTVKWHWENGHFVCLSEERFGDNDNEIGAGQTAAEIIYEAAQDYRINPQVLLVLLEKETSLITDPIPNDYNYRRATGYGCPDTAACSSKYYGFKNQIRNAAWLFRYTLDNGYYGYPEKTRGVYVGYHPNSSCGGTEVYIENRATSALYRYTPYQPNAASLAAGYGTGDKCSSYGNRNFYLYFTNWFGSTQRDTVVDQYQSIPDGEYTIVSSLTSNTALAVDGVANGSNVAMRTRNASDKNQRWRVQYHPDDHSYTFINVASGRVMDLDGQRTQDGGNIHIYDGNDTCAQRWYMIANSDGSRSLLSACSKLYATSVASNSTASGANVHVYTNSNASSQQWFFIPDAAIPNGTYEIVYAAKNTSCLDIAGGVKSLSNSTNVQVYERNGTGAQKWQLKYNQQDGTYTILNPYRELSLDVQSGGVSDGSNVQMYSPNDTPAQKWYILPQGNGYIIASMKSGRVLNMDGSNAQVRGLGQTNNQTWQFEQTTSEQQIEDGIYELVAGTNSQKTLDVNGGVARAKDGTNVQIYGRNQTDAQRWHIIYDKRNDAYEIINVTSNLSLDVADGSLANGANIQVFTRNGTLAQRWSITQNKNGSFTIASMKSGLVLDIVSAGNYDGANVWQYTSNNTPAQQWQLVKISE